jgi:ssDNA-binding Zn-finger/Zn-ribbon topoisomerase 1
MSDDIVVTCVCGAPMAERLNRQNNSAFMGCTRFPDCTETQKTPAFIEVKRAGGLELPGFETVAQRPAERGGYPG